MKSLLTLASFAALLAFSSCEKKYCFNCTTNTSETELTIVGTDTTRSSSGVEIGPEPICDKTQDEADEYVKAGTYGPTTVTMGSTTTTTTSTTTCVRQ